MHTNFHSRRYLSALLLAFLVSVACSKGEQSAVSDNTAADGKSAETSGTPLTPASPTSAPTPETIATTPGTPVGPVGQATPAQRTAAEKAGLEAKLKAQMGSLPITVMPAQPMLTPTPDPFPPRPTPAIVEKEGKIIQQWQAPPEAANILSPVKNNPDASRIGREYYMQRCVGCHGNYGKGNGYLSRTILKPPTNLASRMVQANTDGELYWKITNGKSPMPANRVRFTDEQRWFIVAYLRTFKP